MKEIKVRQKLPNKQLNKSDSSAETSKMEYLPSLVSILRIAIIPPLAYAFMFRLTLFAYALFLFAVGTDWADGYVARRIRATSEFGAYFDSAVDLIFILSMFGCFFVAGCYPYWLLPLILFVYLQFVVTSLTCKITYDPLGKYHGSLLYGVIGLTFLFSGKTFYDTIITGVVSVTFTSLLSRLAYCIWSSKREKRK